MRYTLGMATSKNGTARLRRMTFYVSDPVAKELKAEAKARGLLFAAYLEQLVHAARLSQERKAAK